MPVLDSREQKFEGAFTHSAEVKFKIEAKRAKLVGYWAAEQLKLKGDKVESYAKQVMEADLKEPGYEDLKRKVKADFESAELDISDHRLNKILEEKWKIAERDVMQEVKSD